MNPISACSVLSLVSSVTKVPALPGNTFEVSTHVQEESAANADRSNAIIKTNPIIFFPISISYIRNSYRQISGICIAWNIATIHIDGFI